MTERTSEDDQGAVVCSDATWGVIWGLYPQMILKVKFQVNYQYVLYTVEFF